MLSCIGRILLPNTKPRPRPISAGHPYDCEGSELSSLERRCLLQITDGTSAVEEFPLELRENGIPAHEDGFAQELQNLLFFLNKGSTIVVIFSPLNRLIDIDCHPFFVFGKCRVGLLEIAEFLRFIRRTRSVGEQRPEFGCFGSILLRGEHLTYRLCVPRDHLPNRMRLATLTSIGMSLPPSSRCRVQRL
jgi:hypothetical protein